MSDGEHHENSDAAMTPGSRFERRGEVREVVVVAGDHVTWRNPGSSITHRMWMPYWRRWLEPAPCKPRGRKTVPTV